MPLSKEERELFNDLIAHSLINPVHKGLTKVLCDVKQKVFFVPRFLNRSNILEVTHFQDDVDPQNASEDGGGVEIYVNIRYIFLTCLLGPIFRSLSHCREGTRVLRVGKLGLLPPGVLAVLPYEFTSPRSSEQKSDKKHFVQSQEGPLIV